MYPQLLIANHGVSVLGKVGVDLEKFVTYPNVKE